MSEMPTAAVGIPHMTSRQTTHATVCRTIKVAEGGPQRRQSRKTGCGATGRWHCGMSLKRASAVTIGSVSTIDAVRGVPFPQNAARSARLPALPCLCLLREFGCMRTMQYNDTVYNDTMSIHHTSHTMEAALRNTPSQ